MIILCVHPEQKFITIGEPVGCLYPIVTIGEPFITVDNPEPLSRRGTCMTVNTIRESVFVYYCSGACIPLSLYRSLYPFIAVREPVAVYHCLAPVSSYHCPGARIPLSLSGSLYHLITVWEPVSLYHYPGARIRLLLS